MSWQGRRDHVHICISKSNLHDLHSLVWCTLPLALLGTSNLCILHLTTRQIKNNIFSILLNDKHVVKVDVCRGWLSWGESDRNSFCNLVQKIPLCFSYIEALNAQLLRWTNFPKSSQSRTWKLRGLITALSIDFAAKLWVCSALPPWCSLPM